MEILNIAIIGVGSRGAKTYGDYLIKCPDRFKITSICEIKPDRLKKYQVEWNLDEKKCFVDEKEFFKEKRADAIIIATLDASHVRHALMAMDAGYENILLEKPITCKEEELAMLQQKASEKHAKILVCHVLRYTVAMNKIKEIIDSKELGELISIDHLENVAYWHQAHSFVRGNWRDSIETSPMILAKCCHDLDLIAWFANSKCKSLTSYGDLYFFRKENALKNASKRCLDCIYKETCAYSAYKFYIEKWEKEGSPTCWPYDVLADDKILTKGILLNALKTGPYGRCVFYCDNNVVDSQSVNILFENKVTANLKMTAFNKYSGRYIHFFLTYGEIILNEHEGTITIRPFAKDDVVYKISDLTNDLMGHGGGDTRMVDYFYDMIINNKGLSKTSLSDSIQSHKMAFDAEKSRLNGGKLIEYNK